ncbi:MAG: head-tail connector protein [Devosia sp.]|nr:head-tail connector protein [Devosia sp.]
MTSYLISGPAAEPLTLDEARAFVRKDDTGEDALLASLVTAARLHVESVTGRALISQSWRLPLDCWPDDRVVPLPVGPVLSLTSITAYDLTGASSSLSLDGVLLDAKGAPPRLFLPAALTPGVVLRERQGIEIDYLAGYGTDPADVPAGLRQAVLLLVGYWFENRDALAIAGSGALVPSGFDQLVAPYRAVRL